jgi:hypothetical protein
MKLQTILPIFIIALFLNFIVAFHNFTNICAVLTKILKLVQITDPFVFYCIKALFYLHKLFRLKTGRNFHAVKDVVFNFQTATKDLTRG